jgi:hypothetical protein
MSIYVLRNSASESARVLAEALNGRRVWKNQGGIFSGRRLRPRPVPLNRGDVVVCWGTPIDTALPPGTRSINNIPLQSKYQDAIKLKEAGVSTVEVTRQRPAPRPVGPPPTDPVIAAHAAARESMNEFVDTRWARTPVYADGVRGVIRDLNTLLETLGRPAPVATPAPPQGEWLGRSNDHVGGDDLLNNDGNDYFVKKEAFVNEYRVHSFNGKSIRAGKKVLRDGFQVGTGGQQTAHPWIRSWDGGWRIAYDGVSSKQRHRDLAHAAVKALGLTFGAVDIGERADGSLVVLEVNRAPGLEGGTIDVYRNAIQGFLAEVRA